MAKETVQAMDTDLVRMETLKLVLSSGAPWVMHEGLETIVDKRRQAVPRIAR